MKPGWWSKGACGLCDPIDDCTTHEGKVRAVLDYFVLNDFVESYAGEEVIM